MKNLISIQVFGNLKEVKSFIIREDQVTEIVLKLLGDFSLEASEYDAQLRRFLSLEPMALSEAVETNVFFDTDNKTIYIRCPDDSLSGVKDVFWLRFQAVS